MSRIFILTALLLIFICSPVLAKDYNISTVRGLAEACANVIEEQRASEFDDMGYGLCYGYVRGIKNTHDAQKAVSGLASSKICFPRNATWLQIIKVYMKWVDNHPEALGKSAWVGFVKAMAGAFTCKLQ